MILHEEQKKLLRKYLDNADDLINADDIYELECALDEKLTEIGFDEQWELNETGHVLQKLYDQIYVQNS